MPDASTEGSAERHVVAELTEEYAKISAGTVPADASSLLWIRRIEGKRRDFKIPFEEVGTNRNAVREFERAVECDYLRRIVARFQNQTANESARKPSVDEVLAVTNAVKTGKFTLEELLLNQTEFDRLLALYSQSPVNLE